MYRNKKQLIGKLIILNQILHSYTVIYRNLAFITYAFNTYPNI